MQSAPASIPPITLVALPVRFGESTLKWVSRRLSRPAACASRNTGTRPADDTRFGSSKTARTVCESFTYEVSLPRRSDRGVVTPIFLPSKGFLVLRHAHPAHLTGGSGLRAGQNSTATELTLQDSNRSGIKPGALSAGTTSAHI